MDDARVMEFLRDLREAAFVTLEGRELLSRAVMLAQKGIDCARPRNLAQEAEVRRVLAWHETAGAAAVKIFDATNLEDSAKLGRELADLVHGKI